MEGLFWPILLLGFGLAVLVAEVFLPSGGLLGILAGGCLLGSGYLAYTQSSTLGGRWVMLEATLVPAAWVGALYGLPRTRMGRRVYLQPPTINDLDDGDPTLKANARLGRAGRVMTPLRPSGLVEMDGRRVEALAESGLIAAGVAVTVVAVRSGQVVVRADPRSECSLGCDELPHRGAVPGR